MNPSSLYKYMPFIAPKLDNDSDLQQKRKDCFEIGEIWYPEAKNLNDPYECNPEFILRDEDIDSIVNSLTKEEFLIIKGKSGIPTKEKLVRIMKTPNVMKLPTSIEQPSISKEFIHRALFFGAISALSSHDFGNIGVLSLTENPFNLRMWAHYGGNSRGICLQFQRTTENDLGSKATKKVNYVTERPEINFHERFSKQEEIITTKFKDWTYEREWRHWKKEGGRTYPFPGKLIKIIFGLNCDVATIEIIKDVFGESIDYEEIVLNKKYSLSTDCGLNHTLSKIDINWD